MQLPDKSQLKKNIFTRPNILVVDKFTPKQKKFSESLGKASNQSKENNEA